MGLGPGMTIFEGDNGEGKSNLLEAAYILAVTKSPRTASDRELIRHGSYDENIDSQVQIAAVTRSNDKETRLQIGLRRISTPPSNDQHPTTNGQSAEVDRLDVNSATVQKQFRINGVPRRASALVGELNAVMFSAEDMELALGAPSVRRRYLDILISQVDQDYMKALQRYQRVIAQRNQLLKAIREGHSRHTELDFWNNELASAGSYVMAARTKTITALTDLAAPIFLELYNRGDFLQIVYRPNVSCGSEDSEADLADHLRSALEERKTAEVLQGFTLCGPHRDDLQIFLGDMDVGVYASRGQCRLAVLAMRLAEASYLNRTRGDCPVILLDDVLSELDPTTKTSVLDLASNYDQSLITTADPNQIDKTYLSRATRFMVRHRNVEPLLSCNRTWDE